MTSVQANHYGFTLIELISVLVIAATLAAITSSRFASSSSFELQSARDRTLSAFVSAQQLAMVQSSSVRLKTQTNVIEVAQDINNDGIFSASESVSIDGQEYPLSFPSNISISSHTFTFDRRGRTSSASISLVSGSSSVVMTVSSSGYIE